ncbi:membrane protein [Longimycelium tulufanense]|uniref:Membrane protein n=1 Tax=Longimycelium tulufanense TaxID=907463 RepID=A0A8J3FUB0_9PSEU|nr:SNG1 family protein [Longimycelium tulufanense]GGM53580.1 membrane protein [Longimycelium tulufanense]
MAANERPERGLGQRLREAVTVRAALLVLGVFLLQLAFILSYVGALHHPEPHKIPLAVAAPQQQIADQVVDQLNELPGTPIDARRVADETAVRDEINQREVDAGLVVNPTAATDHLLLAGAAGPALASVTVNVLSRAYSVQGRELTVTDIKPVSSGDGRGLSSFYVVIGWMVGGYLVAAILGLAGGARPATFGRTIIRLTTLAVYAIASGWGGAVIVGPVLDALPGGFVSLWAVGALVVFATAAATMAAQTIAGVVGIGVAILAFVVLGNPSAGGPYPQPLLPTFWREIGPYLPPGAGTTATRSVAYFDNAGAGQALWILAIYAIAGVLVTLVVARLLRRDRGRRSEPGSESAGERSEAPES